MNVVRTAAELRSELGGSRAAGLRVGFVPTMGALHEGHVSLVRAARAATDVVVMSIFVNPLQFVAGEDFATYPRDEATDLGVAEVSGVDVVFIPSVGEMYPEGRTTTVSVGDLGDTLEGRARPGHFDGVATVVAKLFNIVQPDVAFFGQKDAQQVAVVRRMVADLSLPVTVVVGPTVRARDGLALSSRNAYLSADQRTQATALYRALEAGCALMRSGADPATAAKQVWEVMASSAGVEPEYADAVDPDTFGPPENGRSVLLVVAAHVGPARLIDNVIVQAAEIEGGEG
ncbi:MAG: pantoate--beta-alanine ligase [Actinomycetota bacterium]